MPLHRAALARGASSRSSPSARAPARAASVRRRPPPPGRRCAARAEAEAAGAPQRVPAEEALATCDLPLRFDSAPNVHVGVYGVVHCVPRGELGDAILAAQPAAVVVETAASTAHGQARGNTLSLEEAAAIEESCVAQYCAQCAQELASRQATIGPEAGQEAYTAARGHMGGEQLAYVATWLASARLVFGDRPKNTTWRRLAAAVDAASADRCYTAANLERYYGELLPQLSDKAQAAAAAAARDDAWNDVAIMERDTVLLHSLREAAEAEEAAASAEGREPRAVVGVVGESHVEGMLQLAASAAVSALPTGGVVLGADKLEALEPLMAESAVEGEGSTEARLAARACLEMVTAMRCNPEVVEDMQETLGDVMSTDEGAEAYAGAFWLYGEALPGCAAGPAGVPPEVADDLRCAWPQGSDSDGLDALRAMRPAEGGAGFCRAATEYEGVAWAVPSAPPVVKAAMESEAATPEAPTEAPGEAPATPTQDAEAAVSPFQDVVV